MDYVWAGASGMGGPFRALSVLEGSGRAGVRALKNAACLWLLQVRPTLHSPAYL